MRIPPLRIQMLLESNPLQSRILVGRLAVRPLASLLLLLLLLLLLAISLQLLSLVVEVLLVLLTSVVLLVLLILVLLVILFNSFQVPTARDPARTSTQVSQCYTHTMIHIVCVYIYIYY